MDAGRPELFDAVEGHWVTIYDIEVDPDIADALFLP
jgi:hypothetical protein